MARKSKKKTDKVETPEVEAEDIVSETVSETVEAADEMVDAKVEELIEDAEVVSDETAPEIVDEGIENAEAIEDVIAQAAPEDIVEEATSYEPTPAPLPEATQQGPGFAPLLLGGLVAGGIGYGVSYFQWSDQSALQSQIEGLQSQIEALPAPADTASLETQISGVADSVQTLTGQMAALNVSTKDQLSSMTDRMDALERQPNEDGTLTDTALAAFEADMQALRDQLSTQETDLQSMVEATRAEAIAIEENAVATAKRATARTVLAQVQTAIDSGAPLGALLSDLGGALDEPVPDALQAVSDGAPTLQALQEGFPSYARSALSVARAEGVSGESSSGFGSFVKNQLGVRSVTPQEGDSTDAVLSRVEASVKGGQLNDALAEIAGLPEVVRGSLTDWVTQADARAAALDAVAQLSDKLNIN